MELYECCDEFMVELFEVAIIFAATIWNSQKEKTIFMIQADALTPST